MLSFSNTLYRELKGTDIKITLLCPGATETELPANANNQDAIAIQICSYETGRGSRNRLVNVDEREKIRYSMHIF